MEVVLAAAEEEEEIELSLGLSVGGGGRKFEKKSNNNNNQMEVDQKSISSITFGFQFCENYTESRRIQNEKSSSSYSYSYSPRSCVCSLSVDDGGGVLDPEKMRREIHKMRRLEARKKQLQKKRNGRKYFVDDLEDGSEQQQICKKLKSEEEEEEEEEDVVVGFQSNQYVPYYHHMMPSWIPPPSSSSSSSSSGNGDDGNIVHPIAPPRRRSFKPSWIPFETSVVLNNRELPMMKSFDFEQNVSSSSRCDGDHKKTAIGSAGSGSSSSSSSSAVSDYGKNGSQCHGGGSSCETRSHSCQSPPPEQQPQLNVPVMMSNVQVQSELNTSFNPTECSLLVFEKTNTNTNNIVCANDAQSNPNKTEEKQVPVIDPHPIDKPNSVTDYPPPAFLRLDQHSGGAYVENFKPPKPQPPRQLKRTNEETSKPLIPEPPHQLTGTNGESNLITPKLTQPPRLLKRTNEEARKPLIPEPSHQLTETSGESNLITPKPTQPQTESLPRMPCVSTVGNGPNGKTVTGFLYRYTKTEVSIICVCHGSSFTPAEFVKHAGGTDVFHPLKDIVVVP